jgi:hypothetical protein
MRGIVRIANQGRNRMGFMDKAKQLAEQAQQKLDEAQKNFNQSGSQQEQGDGVRYDEHGRPIQDAQPEGGPPAGEPAPPAGETPPPPAEPSGGANASPDPFKPIDQ